MWHLLGDPSMIHPADLSQELTFLISESQTAPEYNYSIVAICLLIFDRDKEHHVI
jgi:hypothetical protein